jgi:phosphoglycerate dehydrogenase-like enzyme
MRELESLLPEADFVALSCPLTKETEKLIDAEALGRMKPSAYLVNVARELSTRRLLLGRSPPAVSPAPASM